MPTIDNWRALQEQREAKLVAERDTLARNNASLLDERDRLAAEVEALRADRADVLLNVIQALNQNPYSLTKSECIEVVKAMRDAAMKGKP